jgi:SAM-dependent methyltransferase
MKYACDADYMVGDIVIKTPFFECKDCDIFFRHVTEAQSKGHFQTVGYVQPEHRPQYLERRKAFFEYLLVLVENNAVNKDSITLADFGCSYGHMIELAKEKGMHVMGVEQDLSLVKASNKRGLDVYESVSDLPGNIDVFTMIDSLYYVSEPNKLISQVREKMNANGTLIIRVGNRNLYASVANFFKKEKSLTILGDCVISYSIKGIKKLLNGNGFTVNKIVPAGKSNYKKKSLIVKLIYLVSFILTYLMAKQIVFSPGVIYVAKRQS